MASSSQAKYSEQYMQNASFDESFSMNSFIPMTHDPTGGSISRMMPANPMNLKPFDYVSMALSNGDATETYTFKSGGSGGTTTNTVTIVYTDSSREVLSSVTKT